MEIREQVDNLRMHKTMSYFDPEGLSSAYAILFSVLYRVSLVLHSLEEGLSGSKCCRKYDEVLCAFIALGNKCLRNNFILLSCANFCPSRVPRQMFHCAPEEIRKSCEKGTGYFSLESKLSTPDFVLETFSPKMLDTFLEQKAWV